MLPTPSSGFEDPLLLAYAQQQAAAAGTPQAYKLTPWLYTPQYSLAYPNQTYPLDYLSQGE